MWIWNPGKSVGKLFFEKKINLDELPFDYSKVDEDGTRVIYELEKQGVRISVDKGIFTSAELRKELVFKGTNLVGANTEAVLKIINDF